MCDANTVLAIVPLLFRPAIVVLYFLQSGSKSEEGGS